MRKMPQTFDQAYMGRSNRPRTATNKRQSHRRYRRKCWNSQRPNLNFYNRNNWQILGSHAQATHNKLGNKCNHVFKSNAPTEKYSGWVPSTYKKTLGKNHTNVNYDSYKNAYNKSKINRRISRKYKERTSKKGLKESMRNEITKEAIHEGYDIIVQKLMRVYDQNLTSVQQQMAYNELQETMTTLLSPQGCQTYKPISIRRR